MTESGTATFTNPADYQTGIGDANVSLVLTARGDFKARLTWLKLRHLHVLRGHENVARIAYVSLLPGRAFASLPMRSDAPPIWSGMELKPGDVIFHSIGERAHQWTKGASQWGLVSLPPGQLAAYGRALTEQELTAPPLGRLLRPSSTAVANLRRLLSSACRVAETKPEIIAEQEAARGLEQELIHALVICLTANDAHRGLTATSCGNHGPLRGRIDSACCPTDEHGRALRRRRCAAADVAGMLRRVLGHEPQPVSSAATTEPGTCGPAASRSHDGKCREDC